MNKKKIGSICFSILLALIALLLLYYIYFRFVASISYNDERLNLNACEKYSEKMNFTLIKPLNAFMYNDSKMYSCAINDLYEKAIVLNENGEVQWEGNYRTLQHNMEQLEATEVGMYKGKLVIVKKSVEENLEIQYYDMQSGEEVFSLQQRRTSEDGTME